MNGKLPISKSTLVDADSDRDRWSALYDILEYNAHCTQERMDACNSRFKKLERRKKFDTGLSAVTGFTGGVGAAFVFIKTYIADMFK